MTTRPQEASADEWTIRGSIKRRSGAPAGGLDVRVVRRSLRAEEAAGEARTGHGGRYEVVGTGADARPLHVRVVGPGGVALIESYPIPPAGEHVVDLVVPDDGPLTEYERLAGAVAPLLDGVEPSELSPDDVAFVGRATGIERPAVAAYAAGARLARERGLSQEVAYAFARAGGPERVEELIDGGADLRRYVIEAAVAGGVIPGPATLPEAEEDRRPATGIDQVAGDHPRLVGLLTRLVAEGELASDRELVRLDEADWAALLDRRVDDRPVGTPSAFQEAYGAGAEAAYARELARRVEAAFPGAAIAHRLRGSDLPGAGDLARFLEAHEDFDLLHSPASSYLRDHPSAVDGLAEPDALRDRLAALQRVARIAPRFGQLQVLLREGLDSAWRIAQHARSAFADRFGELVDGREAAEAIHDRAEDTVALMLTVHTSLASAFVPAGVRGITIPAPPGDVPDWEELFGPVSLCACPDCRSLLSPAAYFVDLLAWLRSQPSALANRSALDLLLERRPDLRTLRLTCENTNVTLPAVDLALELLEGAISPATAEPHDDTGGDTPDLVALPEHVNVGAYRILAAQVFPWTLPYDLARDAARIYLGQFGITRASLMEAFAADSIATAAEELGIPPMEAHVLTGSSAHGTAELWGVADLATLRMGSVFLWQSGLAYDELAELVATRSVQRLAPVSLDQRGERCDPEDLVITPLDDPVLAGIVRFVRLRRALGWSTADLDAAIIALDGGDPTALFLRLVDVERLRRDLRLPVARLAAFFADMDAATYRAVYLDPALTRPGVDADPGLELRADGTPAGDGDPIAAHARAIAAALGVSEDELSLLVASDGVLSLHSLSALFRTTAASRALRVSVADLLTLIELTGADPFAEPAAMRRFAASVRGLRARRVAAPDLDWLLTGRQAEASRWALPVDRVAQVLRDLRAGLTPFWTGEAAHPWGEGAVDLVAQTVATALGLDPAVAVELLTRWTRPPAIEALRVEPGAADAPPGAEAALQALARAAAVIGLTAAGVDELRWLYGAHPGWSDLNRLPAQPAADELAGLERLLAAFDLRDALPGALDVVAAALDPGVDARAVLLDRTGWSGDDVDAAGVADLSDERALAGLRDRLAYAARLGVPLASAAGWAAAELAETAPGEIVRALRARYEADQWPQVAAPLRNALRERQRAACLAHLLHVQGLASAEALSDHYLIDVEMSSCQLTSRIRQATASAQRFVQRCLLGREPVALGREAADEWDWMSRYRVWEANRKVFLYPENWIEPELRDDKTPLFEELESALLQDEVSDRTAGDALADYLRGLDEVARLDVRAVCSQRERDETKSEVEAVHVVARTPNEPHVYHYRRRLTWNLAYRGETVPLRSWTPWERVTVDVSGDHLLAVVHLHRLYLFWPLFADKADEDGRQDLGSNAPARRHLEIQMAWTEYREAATGDRHGRHRPGTWASKQVSTGGPVIARRRRSLSTVVGNPPVEPTPDRVTFRVREEPDQLAIDCYLIEGEHAERPGRLRTPARLIGRFLMPVCGGGLVAQDSYDPSEDSDDPFDWQDPPDDLGGLPRALPEGERLVEDTLQPSVPPDDDALYLSAAFAVQPPPTGEGGGRLFWTGRVLERTPGSFHLVGARQDPATIGDDTLVFEDGQGRSFLVERLPFRFPRRGGYLFTGFYHPYLCDFVAAFNRDGLDGLLGWSGGSSVQTLHGDDDWFATTYRPVSGVVATPLPTETVDFGVGTPYGVYNWELFFHVPLLVATRLSTNQRFEDAQRWYHRLFDPRDASTRGAPGKYWRVLPFVSHTGPSVETLLQLLARMAVQLQIPPLPPAELMDLLWFALSVAMWRERPFEPHLLARTRPTAYQKTVVIRYVENLIAWGDSLFRQDTREAIDEAAQLYVQAADILGPTPPEIDPGHDRDGLSWADVEGQLDDLSNPLVRLENALVLPPLPALPGPTRRRPLPRPPVRLHYGLFYCIPRNERLTGLRTTIADRLAKIRHCRNIDGIERQLALFDPPIDPGLLVRAVAAGIDIGAIAGGQGARPLPYRFSVVVAKAMELCGEVRTLGGLLLGVLEKRDAEALALLRSSQERRLLDAVRTVRERQVEEAQDAIDALAKARAIAQARRDHYRGLELLNASEKLHLESLAVALALQLAGQTAEVTASSAFAAPNVIAGSAGLASSPVSLIVTGGTEVGSALQSFGRALAMLAGAATTTGALAAAAGNFQRRAEDWSLQVTLGQAEMDHIDAQIVAAQVRLDIAQRELQNHDLQIDNAQAVDDFLRSKFTSQELYGWMAGQAAAVHYQAYQLAFDLARRAEAAHAHELGLDPTSTSFVSFDAWDSLRRGLLAGERLAPDLRRLEFAHLEQNERELEITKHVSLAALDPVQLIQLKTAGSCTFQLPETLFDSDFPGHYLRRIRSVAVSIPCITGPYTGVNATLRLQGSAIRFSPDADPDPQNPQVRQVVGPARPIALSGGVNDAGVFELNLRDERYLPFECQGAISTWQLDLPPETNRFDLQTVSDVVLHLRYTAREGSDALRGQALQTLDLAAGVRLFSGRHEFGDQWHRFLHPDEGAGKQVLVLQLTADRLPFAPGGPERVITGIRLIALAADGGRFGPNVSIPVTLTPPGGSPVPTRLETTLTTVDLHGRALPLGEWTLSLALSDIPRELRVPGSGPRPLDPAALRDVGVLCTYARA